MKPILVVVHVYYAQMWQELQSALSNIDYPYDLYVTTHEKNADLKQDVLAFKKDAHFEIVENRGYDVGPFIHILQQINLDEYSYIIKLHTKRDLSYGSKLNGYDMSYDLWRRYALSFLQPDNFKKCIEAFESKQELGMVSNYHLILKREIADKKALNGARKLLNQAGLSTNDVQFVAGTMFMCRAELAKPIKKLNLTLSDFEIPDRKQKTSLAHMMERFFGLMIIAKGCLIEDVFSDIHQQKKDNFLTPLRLLWSFIYQGKVNKRGIFRIKICKIPLPINFLKK